MKVHPKIDMIRELVDLLKETQEYTIHEEGCQACSYGSSLPCNCLLMKIRETVTRAEDMLKGD